MASAVSSVSRIPDQITLIDQNDPNNVYIGNASRGTAGSASTWQIRKITNNSNILSVLFANGDREFAYEWANRATYSYS